MRRWWQSHSCLLMNMQQLDPERSTGMRTQQLLSSRHRHLVHVTSSSSVNKGGAGGRWVWGRGSDPKMKPHLPEVSFKYLHPQNTTY